MNATSDYIIGNQTINEGPMPDPMSDLLALCLQNDRRAQRQLFNFYKDKVHNLVYKSLGPKFDTDDVIQLVFIELFKSLSYFKGDASLDTWVYRICVKVCTTQLRKKYRKRQVQLVFDTEHTEIQADTSIDNTSAQIERKELTKAIYQALDKLDSEKRMTVVLYEIDGKSLEEIASIANIPLGTVKSRLFHGRKILEKHLKNFMEQ